MESTLLTDLLKEHEAFQPHSLKEKQKANLTFIFVLHLPSLSCQDLHEEKKKAAFFFSDPWSDQLMASSRKYDCPVSGCLSVSPITK